MKLEHLSKPDQRRVLRYQELRDGVTATEQQYGDPNYKPGREMEVLNHMLGRKGINPNKITS